MCIVLFLTGDTVLVSVVSENSLDLCETRPGLCSGVEAFQIVNVRRRTKEKDTNTAQTRHQPCLCFCVTEQISVTTYFKCVTSPLVCVAEVRPEFRYTVQVNTLRSAVDKLTPSATITQ